MWQIFHQRKDGEFNSFGVSSICATLLVFLWFQQHSKEVLSSVVDWMPFAGFEHFFGGCSTGKTPLSGLFAFIFPL
jgi:hypothetical protein